MIQRGVQLRAVNELYIDLSPHAAFVSGSAGNFAQEECNKLVLSPQGQSKVAKVQSHRVNNNKDGPMNKVVIDRLNPAQKSAKKLKASDQYRKMTLKQYSNHPSHTTKGAKRDHNNKKSRSTG